MRGGGCCRARVKGNRVFSFLLLSLRGAGWGGSQQIPYFWTRTRNKNWKIGVSQGGSVQGLRVGSVSAGPAHPYLSQLF
jgi:hypothetical protein